MEALFSLLTEFEHCSGFYLYYVNRVITTALVSVCALMFLLTAWCMNITVENYFAFWIPGVFQVVLLSVLRCLRAIPW